MSSDELTTIACDNNRNDCDDTGLTPATGARRRESGGGCKSSEKRIRLPRSGARRGLRSSMVEVCSTAWTIVVHWQLILEADEAEPHSLGRNRKKVPSTHRDSEGSISEPEGILPA